MTNTAPATFGKRGSPQQVETSLVLAPKFDASGLLPAVATDADTGDVLMLAWMNAEALARTVETSEAHFYSRSRGRLWRKGEESGNVMRVVELRVDCDQDAVWLRVRLSGAGVACHTGQASCFYRRALLGASPSAQPLLQFVSAPAPQAGVDRS
jgi:phosphoribosyl-AMP cyclohydrolase